MSSHKRYFLLAFIVLLAFVLRLYRLDAPLDDRHHFRQTDTYAIVLNLQKSGGDLLRPQFFQTPIPENINGYYFGEFPLYQGLIYLLFGVFGESLVLARSINIGLSLVGVVGIYLIGRRLFSDKAGLMAALTFAVLPSSVFWGRAITPDWMAMVSFIAGTALLLNRSDKRNLLFSSLILSATILIKPYYLAFAPFHLYLLASSSHHNKFFKSLEKTTALYLLPLVFLVVWRWWAGTFPAYTRDPDILNLFHNRQGWWQYWQASQWPTLFWQKHFFGELFTTLGGIMSIVGITYLVIKKHQFTKSVLLWLAGSLAITFIISWGSQVHDYYLLPWIPVGSILIGLGLSKSIEWIKRVISNSRFSFDHVIPTAMIGVVVLFLTFFLGVNQLQSYTLGFFKPQGYEIYQDNYQRELKLIEPLIAEDSLTVALLRNYSPLIHNSLQRRGSIYVIEADKECPESSTINNVLGDRMQLGSEFLIVDIKPSLEAVVCSREEINQILFNRYESLFQGEVLAAYKLLKPSLTVRQQDGQLVLETTGIGPEVKLEVGGLPGSPGMTIFGVNWEKINSQVYQVVIDDTQDWQSFKLYYLSPQVEIYHPEWEQKDGFLVRR